MKRIIGSVKYRLAHGVIFELFQCIPLEFLYKMLIFKHLDCVISAIPLHSLRYKERGFNQSDMISKFLSSYIHAPIVASISRERYTVAQAQLSRDLRNINVQGVFTCIYSEIEAKTVILVDDVVTSGNTVKEACKILKEAGASRVFVISIARG